MTGAEHYAAAEALLRSCQIPGLTDTDEEGVRVATYPSTTEDGEGGVPNALAAAQVHATLALADAVVVPRIIDGPTTYARLVVEP